MKPNTAYRATRRILAGDSAVDLVVAASEQLVPPNVAQAYRVFAAAARDVSRSEGQAQRFPPPKNPHVWEEGELLLQTGPTTRSLIMTIQRPPAVEGRYSTAVWFDDWRIVEAREQEGSHSVEAAR